MRRTGRFILLLGAMVVFAVSAFSLPYPFEDYTAKSPAEPDNPAYNDQGNLAFSRTSSNPSVGESVYLICPKAVFNFGGPGSDCWGWTSPSGIDYAIYGMDAGIAFINTATMQVADIVDFTTFCTWRDIKTYSHYAYAVSECGGTRQGMMVMDLQYLPDSVEYIRSVDPVPGVTVTSHNLFVDTIKGYLYAEGTSSSNQVIQIFNLAIPEFPTWVGSFGMGGGIHDMYVMNDTAYVAEGWNPSFSIWDMANKSSPQLITRVNVPTTGYVHNIWPTEDGNYVVTTEETSFHTVKVWDIQDFFNVQMVGEYLAPSQLAHNAQIKGNKIYISHYESGVAIVDISNPANPTELIRYDTYTTGEAPDFAGCWGVYQYATDGSVYASNMDGRLFILEEVEAVLNDTLIIDTVAGTPGSQSRVDVYVVNSIPIKQFVIPFTWAGDFNMTLDSVSTLGLRTEYFEEQIFNSQDWINDRVSFRLTADIGGGRPDLAPGSGPILSLWFTVPFGASGGPNPINITAFNNKELKFVNNCLNYDPVVINGAVSFDLTCCVLAGDFNHDGAMNVADLSGPSSLVSFMFSGGPPPPCPAEGDFNGDGNQDVADLSGPHSMVGYLFLDGPDPICGPATP